MKKTSAKKTGYVNNKRPNNTESKNTVPLVLWWAQYLINL
jgi:hypothetical protein